MVRQGHDPEWPDKIVFAGLTLILAGVAGVVFVGLQATTATVRELVPGILGTIPLWLSGSLSAATAGMGGLAIRHQAAVWVVVGAITGVGSLAIYGAVPLLAVLALGFVVKGWREGEEMAHDDRRFEAKDWPDKAFAASALLLVAGVITLLQAALVFAGRFEPLLFGAWPAVAGTWGVACGIACCWGARECFHLSRPWAGVVGAVAALAGGGFYVIGPLLGVATLELLRRAEREDEFAAPAAA